MASRRDAEAEERRGVRLTSLDAPVFAEAGVTKRELVDYVETVAPLLLPGLTGRPLSVIRTTGARPFMQKNVPKGTPEWVRTVDVWAETSQRTVSYAVCDDVETLLWLANQRAVELHPTLGALPDWWRATDLVLDLDPPEGAEFAAAVAAATAVRTVLDAAGLAAAVKTSGAKGIHVVVPIDTEHDPADVAAATRALSRRVATLAPDVTTAEYLKADRGDRVFVDPTRTGGATLAAAYSPRVRPGLPVSFPLDWDELDAVDPREITIRTAPDLLAGRPSWQDRRPAPQRLADDLVAEGHEIPVPRVAAMHEGRRRKRAATD